MSRDRQKLADYLAHILEAIQRIQRYTEDLAEPDFLQNQLVQDAVIRNFEIIEIIGEASRNIERHYPDFAKAHPEVPLAFAYEMRNVLAHGYFQVDLELVWKTIERDLAALAKRVAGLAIER